MLTLSRRVPVGEVSIHVYRAHKTTTSDAAATGCRVVVSGHSHEAKAETRNGILDLNPGSAGPRRFKLPVTLVRLHVKGQKVQHELIELV